MKRDELELLALADHRVALTGIFLNKQGDFIEALGRLGLDTTDAYDLLYEFERMQVRLLADRVQLRQELEQATWSQAAQVTTDDSCLKTWNSVNDHVRCAEASLSCRTSALFEPTYFYRSNVGSSRGSAEGRDTADASAVLFDAERLQAGFVAERNQLRQELERMTWTQWCCPLESAHVLSKVLANWAI
jgi:hypothetical protein